MSPTGRIEGGSEPEAMGLNDAPAAASSLAGDGDVPPSPLMVATDCWWCGSHLV